MLWLMSFWVLWVPRELVRDGVHKKYPAMIYGTYLGGGVNNFHGGRVRVNIYTDTGSSKITYDATVKQATYLDQ